jgi:uncharacterized glyoxalase superfamily protein PhnB
MNDQANDFKNFILPTLSVANGKAAIEFYTKAFGAIELMTAVAADGTLVAKADQDYGYRLGHFIDPFGHHWEMGRPLKRYPPTA